MAVVEHPANPTISIVAGKTAAHASALAAVAQSVQAHSKSSVPTPSKLKKVEEALVAEVPEKKEPEIDIEEMRHWMRQTIVYMALLGCIVAMGSAHTAGKSFLSTVMCGATAAILTGIAGTVVAQLSLGQVDTQQSAAQAEQPGPPAAP